MVQTNKCGNGILVSVRKTLTSDELWSAGIRVWGCVETRSLLPANQNIWKVYQICKFLQIRRWASTCLRRLTRVVLTSWISSITSKISRIVDWPWSNLVCVWVCECVSVSVCDWLYELIHGPQKQIFGFYFCLEIWILVLEKSWKNYGTFFWDFCGNPGYVKVGTIISVFMVKWTQVISNFFNYRFDVQVNKK